MNSRKSDSAVTVCNRGIIRALAVDDEIVVRSAIVRIMEGLGFSVKEADDGEQAVAIIQKEPVDIIVLDMSLPGMGGMDVLRWIRHFRPDTEVIMITGYPCVADAVESVKLGAMHYLEKPFGSAELKKFLLKAEERCRKGRSAKGDYTIIGNSSAMRKVLNEISRVARTDATVLITGESGTGKELAARTIHCQSQRSAHDCVVVECSVLAESLMEAELFGHREGAFTGATETRKGLLQAADQGTLFLDEVANIDLKAQARLLRVVQERQFTMVGGRKPTGLDIRIVAATNRDLTREIEKGAFRVDLYHRLNVVPIHIPPLRERIEDIGLLAEHFLGKHKNGNRYQIEEISDEALEMLSGYSWPGNVRELENLIERILVLEESDVLQPHHLPPHVKKGETGFSVCSEKEETLEEMEKRYITYVLQRTKGRRQRTADILGINRKTLSAKMKKYGIPENL